MQHSNDPLAAARSKRSAMRAGGREVSYDGIVITDLGGKYQVRVRDPWRKKYISAVRPSRKEADAWGRKTRAALLGRTITSDSPTLSGIAAAYVAKLKTDGKSLSARRIVALAAAKAVAAGFDDIMRPDYGRHLKEWLEDLKADTAINPEVRALMDEWLAVPPPAPGKPAPFRRTSRRVDCLDLSQTTRNTYLRCIKTALKSAAHDGGYLNPLAGEKGFKVPKVGKPVFTPPELRLMLSDERRGHAGWLATALLVYTGCRVDEGLYLRWEDIDFPANSVAIKLDTGAHVKNAKERSFGLQVELRAILEQVARERWGDLWQERAKGFIITDERLRKRKSDGALSKAYYDLLLDLCEVAKVPIVERRSPHSLRHSHAALRVACKENISDIQDDLGHAGVAMTIHYSREQKLLKGHVVGWPPTGEFFIRRPAPTPFPVSQGDRALR